MIHAYLTDGMFELAKVFLESLYRTNGDLFNVLLSTRNLSQHQQGQLKCLYPGHVVIENEDFNMKQMAHRANCSLNKLLKYKQEVESGYVTKTNKVWKLMTAAEDRPRAIYDLLLRSYGVSTPIFHFDIDTLFRKNIWSLSDYAARHDCCLLLRENHNIVKARITISTMTWRRNQRTLEYFKRWMHYLDLIEPDCRPIGYGQTSCWYAFQDLIREGLNYHKLSKRWGYPGKKRKKGNDSYIWSGAIHKLRKDDCVEYFRNELEELKCES